MTATTSVSTGSNQIFLNQEIKVTEADRANGTITVGGVAMNPSEALAFANIARAGVVNEVGFDRLNEAQEFVDKMRRAREVLSTVTQQKDLLDNGDINYGHNDKIIFTVDEANFLTDVVGRPTPIEKTTMKIDSNQVDNLPPSLVQAAGLKVDEDGHFVVPDPWYAPHNPGGEIKNTRNFSAEHKEGWDDWPEWNNSHPAAEPYGIGPGQEFSTVEKWDKHISNEIDEHGRFNAGMAHARVGRGVTETGVDVFRNGINELWMSFEGASVHKDKSERLEEELKHFIEQLGNDNSLHMSKTKNLLGQGNNATEAANSMINSNKDKVDKMINNFR